MISYYSSYTLDNSGLAQSIDVNQSDYSFILIRGTAGALAAGVTFSPSAVPTKPTSFTFFYNANVTYTGGNTVDIFGTALTSEQARMGLCIIHVVYDFTSSAWIVSVLEGWKDIDDTSTKSRDMNMAGEVITLTSNDAMFQWMRSGGGTLLANVSVITSGVFSDAETFVYKHSGGFTLGTSTYTVLGVNIDAAQCLAGDFTVIGYYVPGTGFVTQLISAAKGTVETFIVPVSFETGEVTANNSFVAPCAGAINLISSYVTKALATDDGTITAKINGAAVTTGAITITAPAALDTLDSVAPTGANTFVKGDVISLTTAKTTAGGKSLVTVQYIRK